MVIVIHQHCPQAPGLVTETLYCLNVWSSVTQVKASERGCVCANTVCTINYANIFLFIDSPRSRIMKYPILLKEVKKKVS